ncbi:hypothetical protein [Streptomyces sp. NBC_01451]|uniref:hypothetical protein n=1 Tax=Streptomyces sp. NBC_01451 TaxID=2903872 RepID=UPI002E30FE2B|nr:hypothetical protein [Streptomyces sp. NBC_01451]
MPSVIAVCPSADQLRSSVRSAMTGPLPRPTTQPVAPAKLWTASGPRHPETDRMPRSCSTVSSPSTVEVVNFLAR